MFSQPHQISMAAALVLGGTAWTTGCAIPPGGYEHAWPGPGPQGLTVDLRTRVGKLSGELLAVGDSGLLILCRGDTAVLTEVPHRLIRSGRTQESPVVRLRGGTPLPEERESLRLVSRYPQGVSDALLRRLLEAYGQETVRSADCGPTERARFRRVPGVSPLG